MNEILLEYYQGKPKELIKCEEYLREIIKEIKRDSILKVFTRKGMTRHNKWNSKLEKELANFFNLKEIKIYWDQDELNAYTTPVYSTIRHILTSLNNDEDIINLKLTVVVYEDTVYRADLNEEELMGLILHEIGHNFYICPLYMGFETFLYLTNVGLLLESIVVRIKRQVDLTITDLLRERLPIVTNVAALYNYFTKQTRLVTNIIMIKNYKYIFLGYIYKNMISGGGMLTYNLLHYGDERGADSFAVRYGYGPGLTNGLKKMVNAEQYQSKNKTVATIYSIYLDITQLMFDLIALVSLDPHPSNNQRVAIMLKKLRKDLDTGDYPTGMRKDLEREIAQMEKMYKTINENDSGSNVQIRQNIYDFINFITKDNSDFREIFSFYFDKNSF